MTGRERIFAVLAGQEPDHLPCMPITMMFAADILQVNYKKYVSDYRILADAQIKTAEKFGFDYVSVISDPACEASDLGAAVQWFDDQPPAIIEDEALFADQSAFRVARTPSSISGGRMENRIRGIELLRERAGNELLIEGWVEGPCAEAADLRGLNRLMTDFTDDPGFVNELFEYTIGVAKLFASAQIRAGADIIGIGDAAASLVGPRVYEEFVRPWEKKLVDSVHACGGKVRLHICGNTRRILNDIGALGCDIVDIDYPVPMDQARASTGREQVLAGNLNPVKEVRNGSPETILSALEILHQQARPRWIVAAGCEIVRDTPHDNVRALVDFARLHTNKCEPSTP